MIGCTNRHVCDRGGGHTNMEWYENTQKGVRGQQLCPIP